MKYTLFWTRVALETLAAIWNESADRNAVTAASYALEQNLTRQPLGFGESRLTSVVRVAYHPPLGIEFEVIEDDKRVHVLRVWSTV